MCSTCGCSDHTNVHVREAHEADDASKTHSHAPFHIHGHGNGGHSHTYSDAHRHAHDRGAADASRAARIVRLEQDVLAKNALIAGA